MNRHGITSREEGNMQLLRIAAITVTVIAAGLSPQMGGTASASTTISPAANLVSHGRMSAEIVPLGRMRPMTDTECEGSVCTEVIGSNDYASDWQIWAPIAAGVCTYSTYWVPDNNPAFYGPDLCNDTGQPAMYLSHDRGVQFGGSGYVCGTVLHEAGKPCVYVY